jgi:hypothetical protein
MNKYIKYTFMYCDQSYRRVPWFRIFCKFNMLQVILGFWFGLEILRLGYKKAF